MNRPRRRNGRHHQARRAEPVLDGEEYLGIRVLAAGRMLAQHMSRRDEARDIVDMAIRVIIEQAVSQPDHLIHTKRRRQSRLSVRLGPVAVTVRVQQTLPGCQQPPFPVDIDRAALQHHVMHTHPDAFSTSHCCGRIRIAGHQVFAAPPIEAEGFRLPAALAGRDDRPGIAQPDVAGRNFDDLSNIANSLAGRPGRFV